MAPFQPGMDNPLDSCSHSDRYQYKPLRGDDTIRLIDLTPMRSNPYQPDLHCRIIHQGEDKNVKGKNYVALSYTWELPENQGQLSGDEGDAGLFWIYCDGQPLEVQKNLYLALRAWIHIRYLEQRKLLFRAASLAVRALVPIYHCMNWTVEEDVQDVFANDTGWYLWADAVCINQRDNAERSLQVRRMREIYEYAETVLVWLGPSDHHSRTAIKLIGELHRAAYKKKEPPDEFALPASSSQFLNSSAVFKMYGRPAFSEVEWDSIFRFYSRPWFNRLWIVQEVAAQKYAASVRMLCGEDKINWPAVRDFIALGMDQGWFRHAVSLENVLHPRSAPFGAPYIEAMTNMSKHFDHPWSKEHQLLYQIFDSQTYRAPASAAFTLLALESRDRQATLKQDIIYVPMSMLRFERGSAPPEPDYALSESDVFTSATKWMIEHTSSLIPLSFVDDGGRRSASNMMLPTWVQNFTLPRTGVPLVTVRTSNVWNKWFKKDDLNQRVEFPGPKLLRVEGFQFDAVMIHSPALVEIFQNVMLDILIQMAYPATSTYVTGEYRFQALFSALVAGSPIDAPQVRLSRSIFQGLPKDASEEQRLAVASQIMKDSIREYIMFSISYARTRSASGSFPDLAKHSREDFVKLCAHIPFFPSEQELDQHYDRFSSLWDLSKGPNMQSEEAWTKLIAPLSPYREEIESLKSGRCVIRTAVEDAIGLAPTSTRPGDQIWLLKGARVPFILRPRENGNFELIGEAYIHGYMNGECFMIRNPQTRSIVLE